MTRITVITGGSRGLGRNAALKLARGGCGIVLTYQARHEDADAVVSDIAAIGGRAVALQLDTGDIARFAAFRDELVAALRSNWARDTFDYLVNNAGYGMHAPIAETTEEQFDSLMNVHLKGVFFLTQTLLPLMEDDGRIMNLSTGLARFPLPGYAAHAAMKGAVEVLTRYMAQELGPRGIAVNTVAPGAIETDFAAVSYATSPRSTRWWLRRPRWAAPGGLMMSASRSPAC
ncbi:MAG: SDR family NAD(P)-dependent oxidoreductase [Roseovarius sp.]|jgi:NAD(P)-dependent dehydrogenase (short-subunit alcohol dehydrogenase family)